MAIVDILILLAFIIGVAYARLASHLWTIILAIVLFIITLFGHLHFLPLITIWLVFIAIAAFANLPTFRQKYFTHPLLPLLQKQMPPISRTESEAIEAGDIWWEKDLFCGRPQWQEFLAMPQPKLTTEEQAFIDNQVETLCSMLDDWKILNQDRDLPKEAWEYLKRERFLGMSIPKEFGGLGFSALGHSTIIVKIATRSISAAVNTMVPNSLGPAELLLHYGTDKQKEYYLPKLAKGEEIPCFALTGPEAGSDAGSITDMGIVCRGEYNGKNGVGIRLTWDKRYITLAPIATVLGIAFRLFDPENLLGEKNDLGITLCLVPTSHPGVEIGLRHLPLNLAFMNGPTRGKDVFIPIDWIIGGVEMAGQGWRMLMECLSIGRSISLPALSTACGKLTYRLTGAYGRLRRQFNTSIAHFEGVEEALGNIAGLTYITEACRIMTAGAVDQRIRPAIASAIAKYHMTEMSRKMVAHAMDIHGGHGIQMGPRNALAMAHFAIPVSITVEGANILTRNLIIFGQGAIRCHPFILEEIELLSSLDTSEQKVKRLDNLLMSHVGYAISNKARVFLGGLTAGWCFSSPVNDATSYYYRQLTRMSSALALLADITMMLLGGALKRKERISARLGDILSQLYLASAVLKYYSDQGKPASDLNYVKWAVETCLYEIQVACNELLQNFPRKWLGKMLYFLIFPWGAAYKKPHDMLYHKIVKTMLSPSDFRDRITQYCYVGKKNDDPIRRIEAALLQVEQIEPIWKKFQIAVRNGTVPKLGNLKDRVNAAVKADSLSADEAHLMCVFDDLYKDVIKVDEFSFDLSTVVS